MTFRPVRLVDVELAAPLPELDGLDGYGAVWALLRLRGRPVAWARAPVVAGRCPAAQLARAVAAAGPALVPRLVEEEVHAALAPLRPAPAPPLVTVAVCTRDRPDDLARCLAALLALDYPALDLLVVDNAPRTDATERLVAECFATVRYVREPRPGLDWARNRAILEARGEIVAYTDDDVLVDRGWAAALAAVFAENPEAMAVTGLVVPAELETPAQLLFEEYGGFQRGFERRWARRGDGYHVGYHGTGQWGTGANMAYRREVFAALGGFDPALDVGTVTNGGGDLEMFSRLLKAGFMLVYEPRAMVRHRHRRRRDELREQLANNGVGFYSFAVASAWAHPDERWKWLRFGTWWLGTWSLRRLVLSYLSPGGFPRDLTLAELRGVFRGLLRYPRARRRAAEIARQQGPQGEIRGALPAPAPLPRGIGSVAVRRLDLDRADLGEPAPVGDLAGYDDLRVFFGRGGGVEGAAQLACRGLPPSAARLGDAIAASLLARVWESGWQRWADGVAGRLLADLLPDLAAALPVPPLATEPAAPPLPDDVPVSIVVATRDRPEDLRRCLASLRAQETRRPVEIVVVDNHPASGLAAPVVADFPGVLLVTEERGGVSYARNAGFAACRGAVIVSADDDVVAPPGWLERLVAPFARPEVTAVTGNVLPLALDTLAQRLFEDYGGLGRGFRRREYGRGFFDYFRRRAVPTWDLGGTANAAVRAGCFADPAVGLLEETLGPGMPTGVGEDTYLFYRLLKAGELIVYEPAAWLWHGHRRDMAALRRQIFAYSRGHVAYHLVTFLRDGDPRGLLQIAFRLPLDQVRRLWRRLRGKSAYPARLLLLEIVGNALGPWALLTSWLRVRRQGRSAPYVPGGPDGGRREPTLQPGALTP